MQRRTLLTLLLLLPTAACSLGGGSKKLPAEWWNRPGKIGGLVGVGSARTGPNDSMTRNTAAADARAQLAASLKAEVQSLTELWAQEAGDLARPGSLSSMINNETFTRQIVETTLLGARIAAYEVVPDEKRMYALAVLEDPEKFTDNLVQEVDQELQREAYFETEARKEMARERLDALVARKTAEYEAATPALPQAP